MKKQKDDNNSYKSHSTYPNLFILSKWYLITKLAMPVTIFNKCIYKLDYVNMFIFKKQRTLFY